MSQEKVRKNERKREGAEERKDGWKRGRRKERGKLKRDREKEGRKGEGI